MKNPKKENMLFNRKMTKNHWFYKSKVHRFASVLFNQMNFIFQNKKQNSLHF